jgi:hypothetical protein
MHRATIIAGLLAAVTVAGAPPAAQPQTEPEPCRVESSPPTAQDLPADPLQRCATKALAGRFGKLAPWKAHIYAQVLASGQTVQDLAKRTTYCPHCSGMTCADGSHVRLGICAASRNIPMHAVIWLASDGLLKVCDRGGAVRVGGGYTLDSETAVFDVWVPDCPGGCWTGPGTKRDVAWAIVGRAR